MDNKKKRLDLLMVHTGIAQSRERAKALIMAGKVLVDGNRVDKCGALIRPGSLIKVKGSDIPYVSRGGLKLEKALKELSWDVSQMICLDIGASTGGFTDCLLQHGASKVFAVDVGYGQLAWKLRQDPRVIVHERTNIRKLEYNMINQKMDLVVADTSFISLKTVIPAAEIFMQQGTRILALIKPQFEAGKDKIGKKGVVRDPDVRQEVIEDIEHFFYQHGYRTLPVIPSPILGPKGNQEYIIPMEFLENN